MAEKDFDFSELVKRAQLGENESRDRLIQLASPRVRAFLNRITLNEELAGDLFQETVLEVIRSLNSLRQVGSFWPWVFRIASNKASQFYRTRSRASETYFSTLEDSLLEGVLRDDSHQAGESVIRRDLGQRIIEAVGRLNHRQRAVVSLRCFEDMPYVQIAQAIGCSEVEARVSFFRAKQSLKKRLSRQGFSRKSLPLAIGLFGAITAPSEAGTVVAAVSSGLLKGIGVRATVVGLAKSYLSKISAVAAGLLVLGVVCWYFWPGGGPSIADVRSVHFTKQSRSAAPGGPSSLSNGAYERWYYFLEGLGGPILMRQQRWDPQMRDKMCSWLQNKSGNYYYHPGKKTVYINNYRIWWSSLGVRQLPTDPEGFAQLPDKISGIEYERDPETGFITKSIDNRYVDAKNFTSLYDYDTLDESFFEYGWGDEIKVVDRRDAMHKRGWTYFQLEGHIGDDHISGAGRIPFIYDACRKYSPWLRLNVGDRLQIIDSSAGAYLCDNQGNIQAYYPAGSFFKGLLRPWMGLHTVDVVRRDAAEARVLFETRRIEHGHKVEVTLSRDADYSHTSVVYSIDLGKDVIDSVRFSKLGGAEPITGDLKFTYYENVSNAGNEFTEPRALAGPLPARNAMNGLWLLELAEGSLYQLR